MIMKYAVSENTGGPEVYHGQNLSKPSATALAKKLVSEGKTGIYVPFFRKADGQKGYLNRDGDHAITGIDWSADAEIL